MSSNINSYHAHVYFGADTVEQAEQLCEAARDHFAISMGRVHHKPVGPHPVWSCQLAFPAHQFAEVIPWLMAHRQGLTVFAHGNSGHDYRDHTDHVLWLGESQPLNLSIFSKDV